MTLSSYLPIWPLSVSPALWLALALVIAVLVGEGLVRYLRLPRIVGYVGVGLLMGPAGLNLIPELPASEWRLLVDLALGILLFELGSKVNLRWLKANLWIAFTSLLESSATFLRSLHCSCGLMSHTSRPRWLPQSASPPLLPSS